jgi:hypothetical protein
MLVIRDEQLRALSLPLFEQWMESHLCDYFPEQCSNLPVTELRATIREGIAKARRYGFTADADICRFVDISVVLGADFDIDPQYPWAAAILNDPAFPDAGVRLEMLFEAACEHLRQAPGPPPVEEAGEPEAQALELEFAHGER